MQQVTTTESTVDGFLRLNRAQATFEVFDYFNTVAPHLRKEAMFHWLLYSIKAPIHTKENLTDFMTFGLHSLSASIPKTAMRKMYEGHRPPFQIAFWPSMKVSSHEVSSEDPNLPETWDAVLSLLKEGQYLECQKYLVHPTCAEDGTPAQNAADTVRALQEKGVKLDVGVYDFGKDNGVPKCFFDILFVAVFKIDQAQKALLLTMNALSVTYEDMEGMRYYVFSTFKNVVEAFVLHKSGAHGAIKFVKDKDSVYEKFHE